MSFSFAVGLFWVSVACCAVAQIFIIRSIRGISTQTDRGAVVPRSGDLLEMIWAVLPALGLVLLLLFTWRAIQTRFSEPATPGIHSVAVRR